MPSAEREPSGVHKAPGANRFVGLLVLAGVAALYATTLCRSVYWYDSAEYATAAYTLGVPHPPGYPLYTLLAHGFVVALPCMAAMAVNTLSAVAAVLAVLLAYGVALELGARPMAAAAGAALLATGPSFWFNATVAEVYAPGLCVSLGGLWLLLRAQASGEARLSLLAAGLCGAGMGVHYSIATLGMGFAWLALQPALQLPRQNRPRQVLRLLAQCALAVLLTFSIGLVWLWLRGDVDVQPNQAHPPSLARFLWLVSGGNYRHWFVDDAGFVERSREVAHLLAAQVSPLGAMFGLFGLGLMFRKSRVRALGLLLAMAGNVTFFFRYRVHDLEVFLLPTAALLALCAGCGVQTLADLAAARGSRSRVSWLLPLLLLGTAAYRAITDFGGHDLSEFHEAYDFGDRLSAQLPYRAVILNYTTPDEWKYDAVFGLYFQQVLGRRPDVMVAGNADRALVDRLLSEHRAVFLYAPVAHVSREYALVKQADLYRVASRRSP